MLTKLKLSILFVFFLLLTVNPVELIEQTLVVKLVDSNNNLLLTGSLRYYENGWKTATNNNNGTFSFTTTASTISLEMTYEFASQTIGNVFVTTDTVAFQTKNVQVQLKNSLGNLIDAGTVEYYAGQWRSFGSTVNGIATKELLPKSYSFRMNYEYASNDKQQDISNDQPVVFTTKNVQAHLKNSSGNLMDQGTVEYYAGQWRSFGSTVNGVATKELLPKSYSFRMNYEYASNDKQQDISSGQPVVFTTVNAKVELRNSQNNLMPAPMGDAGTVQYYAGQWRNFGNTSNGIVFKELLPKSYSFRMNYEYASIDKQQDITNNQTVVFNTTKVTLQLKNQAGILFDPGTGSYYSGAWRTIGVTSGGQIFKELLPKSYSFRMNYNNQNQQITQDVNTNPIVVFNYTQTLFPPVLTITQPEDSITTQLETVTIEGTVDNPGTTITINGEVVTLGANGTFSKNVALNIGTNSFIIIATAANSLTTTKYLTIFRESSIVLPPDPVTVAPPLDSTVITTMIKATEFLYTGSNPIQTGVDTGTIDPVRVAVVRGAVLNKNNQPLPGVTVTIHNQPEFGQTLSRLDGMYDMAVNGGGYLILSYAKDGYLPVQRQVNTDWQDYTIVDSVVMIQLDPNVTTIDFSDTIEVAQGSVETDADGNRQATLLFELGTNAVMTLPDGTTQPLTNLNVRATEYTVGENGPASMPADLPPTSGYTYCVELSVDEAIQSGATEVSFDKPVAFYVDNFLEFPVGSIVPVGYYDRTEGKWIASENGRVIKLLSINNGIASLDITGDGQADPEDSLLTIGIDDAEQQKLATLYTIGKSLWRTEIKHFSSWDCNWCTGPSDDATVPDQETENLDKESEDPCIKSGSIIGIQNQSLGERISIAGTQFSLVYNSDKSSGYKPKYSLRIPISDSEIPASVIQINLRIVIAGRVFVYSYPRIENLNHDFIWDGKDIFGRKIYGRVPLTIKVGYVYKTVYQEPAQLAKSFALFSGVPMTGNFGRQEVTLWQEWYEYLGQVDLRSEVALWSIDQHHIYDPNEKTVYFGDGGFRKSDNLDWIIRTDVGTGEPGFSGDGGQSNLAQVEFVEGIAVDKSGLIYISDNNRIRKISKNGIITTIAGTGEYGEPENGIPAIVSKLSRPGRIVVDRNRNIYFTQIYDNIVRKIDSDGIISTFAGVYDPYDTIANNFGDGGLATETDLNSPADLAIGPDGSIYILDAVSNKIKKVSTGGIISTVAGNGEYAYLSDPSGDGQPATNVPLNLYMEFYYGGRFNGGIDVDKYGNLYISEVGTNRVRKVNTAGRITTVAGKFDENLDPNDGYSQISGDGGLAIDAYLDFPMSIKVNDNGIIFIQDINNHRIRSVNSERIINTFAGSGENVGLFTGDNSRGDNGSPTSAIINPWDIALSPDGSLYIAEYGRIRKVEKLLPGYNGSNLSIPSEDGRDIYIFSPEGKHLFTKDRLTGSTIYAFNYYSDGTLSSITDKDGFVTSIQRDSAGNPISITSTFGQKTFLTTNSDGYLETLTNPAGETTSFTYTDKGLLTSTTNPRNKTSIYTFNNEGRLIKDENSEGGYTELTRTKLANGYKVTSKTAEGRETIYQVEFLPNGELKTTNTSEGNLTSSSIQNPDGTTTITKVDGMKSISVLGPDPEFGMEAPLTKSLSVKSPSGLTSIFSQSKTITQYTGDKVTGIVDSFITNNRVTRSIYDGNQNLFTSISPMGKQAFTYTDTLGRVVQSSIPGINPVNYTYNNLGFLTAINQNGRQTSFSYNPKGYLETTTDPLGRVETMYYDSVGRVTTQVLPNNQQILYSYDANGNLVSITPPGKPAHIFNYSNVDLNNIYTPPLVSDSAGATNYIYNLDKELVRTILPDNSTIDIEYDTTNCNCSKSSKPSKILFDRGTISFAYDSTTGNLISVASPDSITTSFAYDGSLPTQMITTGVANGMVGVTYNNDFMVTAQTINGSNPINFTYDNDGYLTSVGSLAISYNTQNGLMTGTILGNTTSSYSYNSNGEVIGSDYKYNSNDLFNTTYTLDSLGRIKSKIESVTGTTNNYEYVYNTIGYLVETKKNGATIANYEFDSNGNRVKYTTSYDTITATYDNQDRMLAYGIANYIYGKNGDLQQKNEGFDTTKYEYDNLGNLVEVSLPNGSLIEYIIDGQNHRVAKKLNGNIVKKWLYAGGLMPVAELDSTDNVIWRYSAGYIIKADTIYRIISDHLGSVRLIVNAQTGIVKQRIDYDVYGNITNVLLIDEFLDFTYAGGLYDADTKLIRFGARDYNAEIGRWTSKDPIGFNGSFSNLYEYVKNDPINRIDLTGLQDLSNPWTIGLEWLTGLGPRSHHFADGDPFTEQLRQHQHIRDLIKGICEGTLPQQGKFNYNLGGVQGVGKYIRDYSTLLTGGLTGNLAVTYLGSYNLNYTVNNGIVNINVNNSSTISSATHPPIIGYTDFWNKYIGNPLDELFSSGPMSKTTQSFNFHEKLKGDCDCK